MDDDTLPEPIIAPKANTGFRFSSVADREAMFFRSADELEEHALKRPESPVVLCAILGSPLGSFVSQHMNHHLSLRGANGSLLSRFNNQSAFYSPNAARGDSGTRGLRWLLSLPSRQFETCSDRACISGCTESTALLGGCSGATVTSYGALSQWTGLDNSALLPPYFQQDATRTCSSASCYGATESAVLNADWAIRHTAPDNRAEAAWHRFQSTPASACSRMVRTRAIRSIWAICNATTIGIG